nr:uncharacterized protein LOC129382607 [Dermacentor andersoni]
MAALRITQDVVKNIREGVRTQIGKCAYLSQAYNLSVNVVCDKIVYSMNTFWAASLLFCLGYLIHELLAQQANKVQLKLEVEKEEEEAEADVQATTVADVA